MDAEKFQEKTAADGNIVYISPLTFSQVEVIPTYSAAHLLSPMLSFTSLPMHFALLLSVAISHVAATPTPSLSPGAGLSMDLMRRSRRSSRTPEEMAAWLQNSHDRLLTKYGALQPQRRSTGTNLMVNQFHDSSFYGSLAIGTPAVSYQVILDTGSADLWVASSGCTVGCEQVDLFDASSSSTFKDTNTTFSITYGSGSASGTLGYDVVQMAGFSVSNQVFAVCDVVNNVLDAPVSGLLGLAFSTISSSGATAFWENLVSKGAWDSPVMAFQLTRYNNASTAEDLEPGGTFTMGFLNSTLYTGDIDYINIASSSVGFWMIPLSSLSVNGNTITLGSTGIAAAIDTGTTAIGGPKQYIEEIYAQIPGSAPAGSQYTNYYTYPCSTTVEVTVSFGGKTWAISPADFRLLQLNKDQCIGSFFDLELGSASSGGPSWIFGDSFLKNVYSVFRYNPPAVGFAQLSSYSLSLNGDANGVVPTPTIGAIVAEVSASGKAPSDAAPRYREGAAQLLIVLVMGVCAFLL